MQDSNLTISDLETNSPKATFLAEAIAAGAVVIQNPVNDANSVEAALYMPLDLT